VVTFQETDAEAPSPSEDSSFLGLPFVLDTYSYGIGLLLPFFFVIRFFFHPPNFRIGCGASDLKDVSAGGSLAAKKGVRVVVFGDKGLVDPKFLEELSRTSEVIDRVPGTNGAKEEVSEE